MASTLQRLPSAGTSEATELNLFVQLRPFPQTTSPDFEASWRDLERRSLLRNPFLSPSFLLPQWDLEPPDSVQLLTIQDQLGRWLFAGLFKRVRGTRNLPLPHLVALRTEHSFKTGVLVDASECEEVIAALWQFLRKQSLHGISFPIFPVRSSLACLLRERCEEDRTAAFVSGVIERATTSLAGMDDQGMSTKRAKSLRRGRRALEKQGALEFRIRDQSGVDDFLHLESLGWKGHEGSALACDPRQTEAFRRVIAGFGRQERVRFAEMVLADQVIASMCLFRSESDYYAFKIGWDPQLERGCPGFLLASEIQSHLPDLPGCERIDGCACPGSFLDHVWSGRKEIGDATFTTTLWGAAAARGTEMVRNLVRRMRGTKTAPPVSDATHHRRRTRGGTGMSWLSKLSFQPREFAAAPSDHRPALDGVRGIAILTVFLYDCLKLPSGGIVNLLGRKLSSAGWTGVDLFFVLSGFLITGILIDSRGKPGYLRSFFARRSLRIFPLYFLALWVTFFAVPVLAQYWSPAQPVAQRVAQLSQDQVWFWTYLQNWMFAFRGHWPDVNYLNHFWSLAVEEQFYLVWPFVVGWASSRALSRICWAAVIGALLLRVGLWAQGAPSVALYVPTLTRVDSLCLGALFAMGLRSPVWYPRLCRMAPWMLVGVAALIAGIDCVWPVLKTEKVGSQTIGHTLLGLLFGTFVFIASAAKSDGRLARILSLRVLTLLGQFSYCMYVLHRPVFKLVNKLDWSAVPESVRGLLIFAAALLGSLALSGLSWKFIEKPILSLKSWFPRPGEAPASTLPEPVAAAPATVS